MVPMSMDGDLLEPLADMHRYVTRMGQSSSITGVLATVRAYLWSWARERIEAVQQVDAGCAPFDQFQQPTPVYSLADVQAILRDLRCQCEVLRAHGLEPERNLFELERFFFLADAILREMMSLSVPPQAEDELLRSRAYCEHWIQPAAKRRA